MAKLPAIHLYPGDWLRDSVSGCSLAAQGLWLRMMFLMHDSDTYGRLAVAGVAIDGDQAARRCGCTLDQYNDLLAELFRAGVPSKGTDGIIYSRRMMKDAAERANAAKRQAKARIKSSHAPVTPVSRSSHAAVTDSSSSISISNSLKETNPPTPLGGRKQRPPRISRPESANSAPTPQPPGLLPDTTDIRTGALPNMVAETASAYAERGLPTNGVAFDPPVDSAKPQTEAEQLNVIEQALDYYYDGAPNDGRGSVRGRAYRTAAVNGDDRVADAIRRAKDEGEPIGIAFSVSYQEVFDRAKLKSKAQPPVIAQPSDDVLREVFPQ